MKRFYKTVTVETREDGHHIHLDGRPLRSPAKIPFPLPTLVLAEAIAAEWDAQGDTIRPDAMPLTQLASTATDRVPAQRDTIIDGVAAYAETDLLCYRAEEPDSLVERQTRLWQPLLDWVALTHDAPLTVYKGLIPGDQPPASLKALRAAVAAHDDWRLTALQNATHACGSLVVALAMLSGRIDGEAAFEISQLDESHQIEKWGADAEAVERQAQVKADILATRRFHDLLGA